MSESKLMRDSDLLQGRITHAEQMKIDKAWARAIKLGFPKLSAIQQRRESKRGWKI